MDIQLNPSFAVVQDNPHALLVLVGCLKGVRGDGTEILVNDDGVKFVQMLRDVGGGQALSKDDLYVSDIQMLVSSMSNGNDVYIITGFEENLEVGQAIFDTLKAIWGVPERVLDSRYGHPVSTVDIAPIGMVDGQLAVGFYQRTRAPFRGYLALAGGYLHLESDVGTMGAAHRIAHENGIPTDIIEQVETIAASGRDPRGKNGWAITILHYALTTPEQQRRMENNGVVFLRAEDFRNKTLAFDHNILAEYALNRVRAKARYSNIPILMMDAPLKMPSILKMYGSVTGASFNEASLRRKLEALQLFEVGEKQERIQGKPVLLTLTPAAQSLMTFSKDLVGGE